MSVKKDKISREEGEEDDGQLDLEGSRLISETTKDTPEIPMCGFLSVRYYQPYFDVDTMDITNRILQAVFYCRREQNFLTTVENKPDGYGPFWISTTLMFVVGVASHLNGWLTSWMKGDTMEYNFQSIINAGSVVMSFMAFAPAILWLVFRTYEEKLRYISLFCLYGYSLFVFIPAVLLCLVPSALVTWLALLSAALTSALFLLRNLAPFVVSHAPKQATIVLGLVGCIPLVFALFLKAHFFYQT